MSAVKRPTPPARLLVVVLDQERDKALLRGPMGLDAAHAISGGKAPKWSPSGRGWVVTRDQGIDAVAWGEYRSLIVRVREVTR